MSGGMARFSSMTWLSGTTGTWGMRGTPAGSALLVPCVKPLEVSGVWLVLLATVGLALKGIWARLAYAEGASVQTVLFYRSALAVPLVLASTFFLLRRERALGGSPARSVSARDCLPAVFLGALFSVGMWLDFQAIHVLGAGVSRVVLFGFPLVVMLLDATLKKRLPEGKSLFGFVVAWLGLALVAVSGSSLATGGLRLSDFLWGLGSMALYGFYVWRAGALSPRIGSVRLAGVSNLATAAVVLLVGFGLGAGSVPEVTSGALGWVAVMVVVSTVAPYFLLLAGIERLGSARASRLSMLGPLITLAAGGAFLGEEVTPLAWAGTLVVLLGVFVAEHKAARAE